MAAVILLLVIVTTIWVGLDAGNLAKRGTGMVGNTSTVVWVFACLLLWIVGFPIYLIQRAKFLSQRAPERAPPWPTAAQSSYSAENRRRHQFTPSAYDYIPETTVPAAGSDHLGQSPRLATQDPSPGPAPPRPQPTCVADELERLSRLLDSGHLSEQEFAALKGRLMP